MGIVALLAAASFGFGGGVFGSGHKVADPDSLPPPTYSSCVPSIGDDQAYTASIQACLDSGAVDVNLPEGTFEVVGDPYNALEQTLDNQTITGAMLDDGGPGTTLKLVRPDDLFTEDRVLQVQGSAVVLRNLVINGGMGDQTCEEAKYDEYADGGRVPGSQGQQQHGVFVAGATDDPVDGFILSNVRFEEISGDAVFLYNAVQNVSIENMTISGFCRSGLTMNSYTEHALKNIVVRDVNFDPQSVAQTSVRGIDIEPNSYLYNITIENVRLPRFESGRIDNFTMRNVVMETRNGIAPTSMTIGGRGSGFVVEDIVARNTSASTEVPFNINMENGVVRNLTVHNETPSNRSVQITGADGFTPAGIVFEGLTVNGMGSYAIAAESVDDLVIRGLDLADGGVQRSVLNGTRGLFFFPSDHTADLTIEDTDFLDGGTGGDLRSVFIRGSSFDGGYKMGTLTVTDSTGTSDIKLNSTGGVPVSTDDVIICNSTFVDQPSNTQSCP